MKTALFGVGLATCLSSGGVFAQSSQTSGSTPYVPAGYQPIDYNPSALRGSLKIPRVNDAELTSPISSPANSTYVEPVSNIASLVSGDYEIEDLQADFNLNVPAVVYFEFDKSDVRGDAKDILWQQAQWLQSNPEATVHLTGHADAVGANAYNYRLGLRRANSAAENLVEQGVERSRLKTVVSKGEEDLAIPTEERELLNRRVITRVTGIRKIPIPATVPVVTAPPVVPAPPPPTVNRLPPPPPPAVKKPEPIIRAQIPEYTSPPRTYAPEPPLCNINASLAASSETNIADLQVDLEARMNAAIHTYNDNDVVGTNSSLFFWAHHTKAQCGIAIGFTKSGTRDQNSIRACKCGEQLMSFYQGAG